MESMKTSEELHALHVELWGWVFHHPSMSKHEWPGWKECKALDASRNGCFACTEAMIRSGTMDSDDGFCGAGVDCPHCPINWGASTCDQDSLNSPYYKYSSSATNKTRKKYAAQIRDLPWSPRPEVKK